MNKWITPILASTLIIGCAETQTIVLDVPQEHQVATNFSAIAWTPVEIPTMVQFQIDESSQLLLDERSAGPVASFLIPGDRGSLDIHIESIVDKKMTIYAPNVVVLNQRNEVIYQKFFADFEYIPAKVLDNDKFQLDLNIIPDMSGDDLNLLIYTSASDLKGETPVLHPAKAFAKAKGTVPPVIPDPLAKHVAYGNLRLKINSNDVVTKRVIESSDKVPSGADLSGFYKNAIRKAVESEDIPKALALLDEAKALNIEDAQEVFVKAVNSK